MEVRRLLAGVCTISISTLILLITCLFYTASETQVWIKIVQTRSINRLTSIDPLMSVKSSNYTKTSW